MENNFNIITQQEFNRLREQGIDYDYAVLIACEKGNQVDLCKDLINKMKQDQEILMRETLANLVPITETITTEK